jgi:hypothetical protein
MKLFTFLFYIVVTLFVFTTGCKKTDNITAAGTMTAKVEGVSWTASTVSDTILNGTITIAGKSQDNSLIWINLDDVGTGIYALSDSSAHTASYNPGDGSPSFTTSYGLVAGGQVNVTSINYTDSIMSGTFTFTGVNPLSGGTKEITQGIFTNLKFKVPLTNIFHADIDGVLWNAGVASGNLALQGRLTIKGSVDYGSKFISIVVPGNVLPGTYNLGTLLSNYYGQYNPTPELSMFSYDGILLITKHDPVNNRIEGSFHFHALELQGTSTATITNGIFKVSYTES